MKRADLIHIIRERLNHKSAGESHYTACLIADDILMTEHDTAINTPSPSQASAEALSDADDSNSWAAMVRWVDNNSGYWTEPSTTAKACIALARLGQDEITALQSRLALAEGANTAYLAAIQKHAVVNRERGDGADVISCRHCGAEDFFHGEDEEFVALKHKPSCITISPTSAAQAWIKERDGLRSNQRTPGAIESCPRCKRDVANLNGECGMIKGLMPCPLKPIPAEPGSA